jgi:hypothetical protein
MLTLGIHNLKINTEKFCRISDKLSLYQVKRAEVKHIVKSSGSGAKILDHSLSFSDSEFQSLGF